jgi:hypothetical protein
MATDILSFQAGGYQFQVDMVFAGSATSGAIVSINGEVVTTNDQITQLDTTFESPSNIFSTTYPYTDAGGISFDTASGDKFNLYSLNGVFVADESDSSYNYLFQDQQITDITLSVCYAQGTRIATGEGAVAVERLRAGDHVRTASGALRPIKWLGHRSIDCARARLPGDVLPVLVAKDAFGDNRPSRDLYLSPAHAVCIDVLGEILVPISALMNGATIRQIDVERVTYWHVELDSHDILLAEDLPAESYIDMGNRDFFVESGRVALAARPDASIEARARTAADFCRPFHVDGPVVEAARAQLAARAVKLGWRLEASAFADMHLVADGQRIAPTLNGRVATFAMPPGAKSLFLVSATSRPCDVGINRDRRDLGVPLSALSFSDGATRRDFAVDDPRLGAGFHPVEDGVRRWTGHRAVLPAELFAEFPYGGTLAVRLAGEALPRWVASDAPAQEVPQDRQALLTA